MAENAPRASERLSDVPEITVGRLWKVPVSTKIDPLLRPSLLDCAVMCEKMAG